MMGETYGATFLLTSEKTVLPIKIKLQRFKIPCYRR